ncbi:DUF2911 domain-containing protein [Ascidiimonas sp. W6]|uniref:DUF2911 domain-containing protein n=1 Tax=Ascidiimonas meishanensis TaxID=3128903 RepID=UPI0030EC710E
MQNSISGMFRLMASTLFFVFLTSSISAQLNLPTGSQKARVIQTIGITDITVNYSRPSVNEREIWGKLVPYGYNNLGFGTATAAPWRAGANENTTLSFSHPVIINGQNINSGTYGYHVAVEADNTATVILSKDATSWGSYFYEQENDVIRVPVKTKEIPHTELLTYVFNEVSTTKTTLALQWEKKEIPLTIEVEVHKLVLNDIRNALKSSPGFNRQSWEQAANYALNNNGDLKEALGWVDAAIAGKFFSQKTFGNLMIKANILSKMNKMEDAKEVIDEALAIGTVFQVHQYGRQLIASGQKEKALEVFKFNLKKHKKTWPVHLGAARGYAANGNYKEALKHLTIAQKNAPDQVNRDAIAANLIKLKNNEDIN